YYNYRNQAPHTALLLHFSLAFGRFSDQRPAWGLEIVRRPKLIQCILNRMRLQSAAFPFMSDFELFSAIMMVLAIVVKLLICLINAKK
ncbi:MAG: hypothetical protein J6E49_05715, partial [Acidaminococcaceae bacterium]|nr:hypothetical protein [Acidaminococcaceae bacterium]